MNTLSNNTPQSGISRQNIDSLLNPPFAIPWLYSMEQPLPGMHLNSAICKWVPDDPIAFADEYGNRFKEILAELETKWNEHSSGKGKKRTAKTVGTKTAAKVNTPVQSEHQCTTAPSKPLPSAQLKEPKAATATVHQSSESDNPTAKEADEIPVSAPVIETSGTEMRSQSQPNSSELPSVEQSKKSRISAKKVDADFDELCREFIHPASLGEKKPVFLPLALRDRLDDIARLSGDRRVPASHIVINIVGKWIDDNRDALNRKISNKDFSI